ncbi:MAG TPA: hypothetical protein PKJ16_12250 [Spirochaetota bacterium]|nr:hypothetical protein [Spirochaetota bacterium]HPU87769.1 hypothetical protein [Spirochaetota bacterium]
MSNNVRIIVLSLLCFAFAGASITEAGEWSKEFGNGKFGNIMGVKYDFKVGKTSEKSWAHSDAYLGTKMFGVNIPLIGADLIAGNIVGVSATAPSQTQQEIGIDYDLAPFKNWKIHASIYYFGITIYSYDRNIDYTESTNDENLFTISKYVKKQMPRISWPVGPVNFEIRYGASLTSSVSPKAKYAKEMVVNNNKRDMKGLEIELAPTISAKAFVEGGVDAHVLRGGVGASLTIFEGWAGLVGYLDIIGNAALVKTKVGIEALKGRIYAYVDRRSVSCSWKKGCRISWSRWINHTITEWKGFVYNLKDYILYSDGAAL